MCPTTTESLVTPTDVNDAKSDFPIAIVAGACAAVIVVIIVNVVTISENRTKTGPEITHESFNSQR